MYDSNIINVLHPSDWITIIYLAITGVLACIFHKNLRWWGIYVVAHAGVICGLLGLAFIPEGSLWLPLQVLRDWYPIATILIFYLEIPPLAQMVLRRYLDDKIMEFEGRLFNGQPSLYLSERFPSRWLSAFLHLCYFSYYPIVVALAGVLYFQGRHESFHEVVFAEVLTFNLCLIWYILMPVLGPYYKFEKIRGPLADGFFFKLVHAILSSAASKGTAFPSSHCAIAVIVVLYAARYHPIAFTVLCPFGVGLVVGTVYGRMHYAVDTIVGTVLAVIIFGVAPHLYRWLL
jgi:membrane-associated phospholipid phosphatase